MRDGRPSEGGIVEDGQEKTTKKMMMVEEDGGIKDQTGGNAAREGKKLIG